MTFETERAAQLEIVHTTMDVLDEFIAGQRPYTDTVMIDDFVLPVEVWPDGSITTEDGGWFGRIEP